MSDLPSFLPGFIAAYSILLVAAASPGPAVAMLMGIGLGQGRRAALVASLGVATGSVALNFVTLMGVGLLLTKAAWAISALRLLGSAYLLWLAWGAFHKAARPDGIEAVATPHRSLGRHYVKGLALQLTNPKALVFWLAIASVGATHGGGPGVVMLFVAGAFAISFAMHAAWALLLSAAPVRRTYAAARRPVEALLGTYLTFAAWRLATDRS